MLGKDLMQDDPEKDIEIGEIAGEVEEIAEEIIEDLERSENEGMIKDEDRKNLFGKSKKEKKDKKDLQIEELNDKLKRNMAEFDNFRKRTEKEKAHMYEIGAKEVIEKILPIVDNFERGLDMVLKDSEMPGFAEGMDKIYKQLCTTLEDLGVNPIDAVGKEFDPNLHNAVMHGEDEELGENIVAEEYQKGYLYKESVVRHSMVRVVN